MNSVPLEMRSSYGRTSLIANEPAEWRCKASEVAAL